MNLDFTKIQESRLKRMELEKKVQRNTQYLEEESDIELLTEGKDIINFAGDLSTICGAVYLGEKRGKLVFLGYGCGTDPSYLNMKITIPLDKFSIDNGKILPQEYRLKFSYIFPKTKQILENSGLLVID